jgi:hypothetical protein
MAALTVQNIVDAGTKPTFSAASTADTAVIGNGSNTFVVYKNADTSAHTLTITVAGNTSYGVANPQKTVTIGANTGEVWVPLRKAYDDGTGKALLGLDAATSVTVAVVKVG